MRPQQGPTYIPGTSSPIAGIPGQQTSNAPTTQFNLASTPSKNTDPLTPFPSFAQTSQSAWPAFGSPPMSMKNSFS
jgi:hypothetical protein